MQRSTPFRIGVVPYLNARPLADGLARRGDLRLDRRPPARLVEALRGGDLDAALVPAFALGERPGTRAVDGVAIGSDGPVRSVLLYCRRPPGEIRHWAPDPDSLSSNALARILLAERYGATPGTAPRGKADAVLVIGDPALKGLEGSWHEVLDLGEAWRALTGKPFVYAVWAIREGVDAPGLPDLLREAKRRGVEALTAPEVTPPAGLAADSAGRGGRGRPGAPSQPDAQRIPQAAGAVDGERPPRPSQTRHGGRVENERASGWAAPLSPADLDYLRHAIRYDLGAREREGLDLFLDKARRLGLLPGAAGPAWV